MSPQYPQQEGNEQHRKGERDEHKNARARHYLCAFREHFVGFAGALGQTRQAFALLRKKLLLSLERLSLALELKAPPISNLFEQAGDSLGLFVVHDVLANEADRSRGAAKGPPWGSVLTERSGDLAMHMTQ